MYECLPASFIIDFEQSDRAQIDLQSAEDVQKQKKCSMIRERFVNHDDDLHNLPATSLDSPSPPPSLLPTPTAVLVLLDEIVACGSRSVDRQVQASHQDVRRKSPVQIIYCTQLGLVLLTRMRADGSSHGLDRALLFGDGRLHNIDLEGAVKYTKIQEVWSST